MVDKKYGESETEKEMNEAIECREIVHRIMDLGITQNQILTLINLFALELENNEKLLKLTSLCKELQEKKIETGLNLETGEIN